MYYLLKGFGHVLCWMSPQGLDRLAKSLAFLTFDIFRLRRRLMLRNLDIALGNETTLEQRTHIARQSMRHFFLTVFETLRAVGTDVVEHVEVEGRENAQPALDGGKGIYILICHLGNWEVMAGAGSRYGAHTNALVKEIGKGGANRLTDELRNRIGWTPIYRKPASEAIRKIRAALKRNELVAFMMDQARPEAPRLPFFGQPAKTLTILPAIWRKNPAPVIPISIRRVAPTRHILKAWPPLEFKQLDDPKQADIENTILCNQALERMIRENPEQYFWLHNRWKA